MNKVPFTPEGFADLAEQLYALPDQELIDKANALQNDLIGWANEHIILSEQQLNFLRNQDFALQNSIQTHASLGILNRLPLILDLPEEYPQPDDTGKWFIDRTEITTGGPGGSTGFVKFEITYNQP